MPNPQKKKKEDKLSGQKCDSGPKYGALVLFNGRKMDGLLPELQLETKDLGVLENTLPL